MVFQIFLCLLLGLGRGVRVVESSFISTDNVALMARCLRLCVRVRSTGSMVRARLHFFQLLLRMRLGFSGNFGVVDGGLESSLHMFGVLHFITHLFQAVLSLVLGLCGDARIVYGSL